MLGGPTYQVVLQVGAPGMVIIAISPPHHIGAVFTLLLILIVFLVTGLSFSP